MISGLEAGDQVVTIGNSNLREDTFVRLAGDPDLKEPPEEDAEDKEGSGAAASSEDGEKGSEG